VIKYKAKLLHDIAEGVRRESKHRIESLEVVLVTPKGEEFSFSLEQALFALANDTHWDERGYWDEAETARVVVL